MCMKGHVRTIKYCHISISLKMKKKWVVMGAYKILSILHEEEGYQEREERFFKFGENYGLGLV
jgi:hypothetical protein